MLKLHNIILVTYNLSQGAFSRNFNYGNEYLNVETRHYSYDTNFEHGDQRTPQRAICTNQIWLH